MANPNVDALSAELAKVAERWFDRWQKAIGAARVANYPYEQFAADVTETWIDGTYAGLYPWSLLGPIKVTLQPPSRPRCASSSTPRRRTRRASSRWRTRRERLGRCPRT